MTKHTHTTLRLTTEATILKEKLAAKLGVSQTAIMEMAIREMAEKRGVKVEEVTLSDKQSC